MSEDDHPIASRGSLEFIEDSVIEAYILESTEPDLLERLLKSDGDAVEPQSLLQSLTQRDTLFFGMFGSHE
jgi:hypothetical protein